jgi:secondary thiamine-phosphate synthase enzyme
MVDLAADAGYTRTGHALSDYARFNDSKTEHRMFEQLSVRTHSRSSLMDITSQVQELVSQSGIREGICYVFCPHTTAGVILNENADPSVQSDILKELDKLIPWRDNYEHAEGNAAAHIKVSLVGSSHFIPVLNRQLRLGTWQGIYLAEFDGPRTRQVWVKVVTG